MRIAIVGSRDYPNLVQVDRYVAGLAPETVVLTGGARGVDKQAEQSARERHLSVVVYPAEWHQYGNKAGMIRNAKIVDLADAVVVFWDGVSAGSSHVIALANREKKPLTVIRP